MPTILVVEDDLVTRRIMEHTLGRRGYDTIMAPDAQSALAHLNATPIDLVLCDIAMPGMSGIELLAHIRKHTTYAELPVVMLTASQGVEDRRRAVELDASAFLTKPTSSSEILQIIERLLR